MILHPTEILSRISEVSRQSHWEAPANWHTEESLHPSAVKYFERNRVLPSNFTESVNSCLHSSWEFKIPGLMGFDSPFSFSISASILCSDTNISISYFDLELNCYSKSRMWSLR